VEFTITVYSINQALPLAYLVVEMKVQVHGWRVMLERLQVGYQPI
jgi:hypothetical protein